MAQFKTFDPNAKVLGAAVFSFLDAMGAFRRIGLQILSEQGIPHLKPEQWYSQQAVLNVFKVIAEQAGPGTLKTTGTKVPDNVVFPPVSSLEQAFELIDEAYHMNHQGSDIGYYKFEKTGQRSGRMECYNPYPCDFDEGLIQGTAAKFKLAEHIVIVKHEGDLCRKNGDDICAYTITW